MHGSAGFAGVVFRGVSPRDYELIYLRTGRSQLPDAGRGVVFARTTIAAAA